MQRGSRILMTGCAQWLTVAWALLLYPCSFACAQPADATDQGKGNSQAVARALVGTFANRAMSITIAHDDGKFQGTITRSDKQFPFTGEFKEATLTGTVDVGGNKSGFTVTLDGDELTLTLGLDVQKLSRIEAIPLGGKSSNTVRKEVRIARSEDVQLNSEVASPDNRRVGFVIQRDGLRHVVIDGVEGPAFRRAEMIEFSPDSKRFSYVARALDGNLNFVVDGKESAPYESLKQSISRFSPDSSRIAFAGMRQGQWQVVIDGKESERYDAVDFITFSPDSKRVAFIGQRGQNWHAVIDGVEQAAAQEIGRDGIVFSPDSKRVAYTAIRRGRHGVIVDGTEGTTHDAIAGILFSPDSAHLYLLALRNGQQVIFVDGQEKATHEAVRGIGFSHDGKKTVVAVKHKGKSMHLIDGRAEPAYDDISPPIFSPDNLQMAYAARTSKKWCPIRDGKAGAFHDQILSITFGPDHRRLAYVARDNGKAKVIVDDRASHEFDEIWQNQVNFSPDGRHVVFGARQGEHSFLVVDEAMGEPIGNFIPGSLPVFIGPDRFQVITRRGPDYYRLEVQIIKPAP